jgi:hypothetical protein
LLLSSAFSAPSVTAQGHKDTVFSSIAACSQNTRDTAVFETTQWFIQRFIEFNIILPLVLQGVSYGNALLYSFPHVLHHSLHFISALLT